MSFSTSFCLTNTGNLPLTTTLSFYTNVNGYAEPPFLSQVLLADVSGSNCPYIINGVPDGTTQIKVQTSTGNCCAVIDISPNNPCSFCDIGFDFFLTNTISQIVAGNLTGSCDSVISDYRIDWYEISTGSDIFKFTTGPVNTQFGPVAYTHPLVGGSSLPVQNGVYKPVLTKVSINGINYSSTSGSGLVQADLNNCFSNVTVNSLPLTCENGPETGDYSHVINFSGASQGITPVPVTVTYQLGLNTKYLAWSFRGYDIPDTLKITYYGSYYNNNPIVLENVSIGAALPDNDFTLTLNPKLFKSGSPVKKVTNISNIVRSPGDYLLITVTPNATNLTTNFNSGFQCLDTFDCETCWDQFSTSPPKIVEQSIITTDLGCNKIEVRFNISGCSYNDVVDSEYFKYGGGSLPETVGFEGYQESNREIFKFTQLNNTNTTCNSSGASVPSFCPTTTGNGTIIFVKNQSGINGVGNVLIRCSSIQDFNSYYNSYLARMNELLFTYSNDPTNINYYQYFHLKQPVLSSDSNIALNQTCGDGQTFNTYYFHTSSVVTTGFTGGYYTMNLTMPTITKQITFTNCQVNCNTAVQGTVDFINGSSLGTIYSPNNQMNTTNQKSNRYDKPFFAYVKCNIFSGSRTSEIFTLQYSSLKYITDSIFYSGSPLTIIPSLSATTCTYLPNSQLCPTGFPSRLLGIYKRYIGWWEVRLPNPLNHLDFEIVTTPLTNGGYPGMSWDGSCNYLVSPPSNLIVIYKVQNGQVIISNPNYIVQSTPSTVYTIYKRYDNI